MTALEKAKVKAFDEIYAVALDDSGTIQDDDDFIRSIYEVIHAFDFVKEMADNGDL